LEAAEQGGMTLEEIAARFALTRERVRQIELTALRKLERQLQREAWTSADPLPQASKAA
jgi:DNA-directed RNA polymerase sigma subunit (sigma70/sigma32)